MSNSIWKTGSPKGIYEEDRLGDYYVAEFHREDGSSFYEAGGTCDICGIPDRWTFLTDLIAQADKAERLQKAVDLLSGHLRDVLQLDEYGHIKLDEITKQQIKTAISDPVGIIMQLEQESNN
jgi:hypothetical protein